MTFLRKVALQVLEKYPDSLQHLCLVTPNRRAGLFLKKYFSELASKAIWAPDVLSMEDFVEHINGISIQEPVGLLLEFYEVYCNIEKEKAEPLEEFLKWAPMLIKDFNDIDAHVSEPMQLFNNVLDAKKIESWNPDGQEPSDFQKKYLRFFERIKKYHDAFRWHLLQKHIAYQGLSYREAARMVKEDVAEIRWKHILFVGFNALNEAEEIIIRTLVKKGQADIMWDADKYYLENSSHEAGYFLRKYRKEWNMPIGGVEDNYSIASKNIFIYGLAQNVNQAKMAGIILKGMPSESFTQNQTAVVLANEELMLPVINSIPPNVEKLNITMGYPLRKTSIYGLFDAVFQMHLTTLRMRSAASNLKSAFYHKDLVRLLRHPAIAMLWGGNDTEMDEVIYRISSSNKAFLSFGALTRMNSNPKRFHEAFSFLFESFVQEPYGAVKALLQLMQLLDASYRYKSQEEGVEIEQAAWFADFESLYPIGIILRKLDAFMQGQGALHDLKTLFMLFQSMARESKLALVGEPLNGLQVMGMLETRNLDFKNLIILSANEDILPAGKAVNSLIPFDVKAAFGMPVYKEKDAVYAYHFYRLLQRAENVYILYNTQTQDLGSSEKSRFITQLQMELPAWNPNIRIEEKIIALPPASDEMEHEIRIPKTPEVLKALQAISEKKGFSPSTLSHYIRCSLFFYFRHIAGIKESAAVEETIEANTLGTVVHEVLEILYREKELEEKIVKTEHIKGMYSRVEALTAESFEKNYPGGDLKTGKNLLLHKVALRFVYNFLKAEEELLESLEKQNKHLTYVRAEENLKGSLEIDLDGQPTPMNFSGFADRIDRIGDVTRIIDYKTGKVDARELKFKEWEKVTRSSKQGKSFQLMMYALMYGQAHPQAHKLVPGILSLRNIKAGLLSLETPESKEVITPQSVEAFQQELKLLMQEIFNTSLPFTRTPDEDNCLNCDFRVVCNR